MYSPVAQIELPEEKNVIENDSHETTRIPAFNPKSLNLPPIELTPEDWARARKHPHAKNALAAQMDDLLDLACRERQLSALREASEWVRESSLIEAADIAKSALSPRANMTQIIQAEKCSKEILKKVRRFDE